MQLVTYEWFKMEWRQSIASKCKDNNLMDSFLDAFQPFLLAINWLNMFSLLLAFLAGIKGAFWLKHFLHSFISAIIIIILGKAFSTFHPEVFQSVFDYILALGLGLLSGATARVIWLRIIFS